jgi:multisubunit Na+/H+ antiporter MnhB subunit
MTAELGLDVVLVVAVLAVALWVVVARRSFAAVVGFVAYGMLLSLVWVRLGTVDVALTEAAIGGGATGLLLLGAVARLRGGTAAAAEDRAGPMLRLAIGALCAVAALALAGAVSALPEPAPTLAPAAAAQLPALGVGNPVTGVLLAYRALDTLLETVVLLFVVIGVWSLAPDRAWGGVPGPRHAAQESGPLALVAKLLPPIGIVIAIHVLWAGADAPGGKFQAGTILATMWLLAWLAGLVVPPPVRSRQCRALLVAGPALFFAIGLAGVLAAGAFLAYPAGWAKPLILVIEVALTVFVAAALALLVVGPPVQDPAQDVAR